jgi:hypothetical protein
MRIAGHVTTGRALSRLGSPQLSSCGSVSMSMMRIVIGTVTAVMLAVLALTSATTAMARRAPPLMPLPGVSVDGASLMSDGLRYVAYTDTSGSETVLDTKTGDHVTIARSTCPGMSVQPAGEDLPIGLSEGKIIMNCPTTHSLLIMEFATSGLSHEVNYVPAPNTTSARGMAGTQWARFPSCNYAGSGTVSCDAEQIFSVISGTIYPGKILPEAHSYADLDSTLLIQPLCAPIELKHPRLEGGGSYERIEGVEAPWVLIRSVTRSASGTTPHLLAWRCGRGRPINLGTISGHPEIGAGIVTWKDTRGFIYAENLFTGKRLQWKLRHVSYIVHTASTIFLSKEGATQLVYSASLRGLSAVNYHGPAPAVVAPPEGTEPL